MWLKSLSMPQLRSLSIVQNILQPINCMWLKSLSMPWLKSLSIVSSTLHTISYIYPKSLSVPWLRSLSIALNTMDRDLSHDSCQNPCLCNVWVENYVYQRKKL